MTSADPVENPESMPRGTGKPTTGRRPVRWFTSPPFRIAVGLALLGWLFTKLDLRALPAALADVRLELIGAAATIILAIRLIGAFRWYLLLRGLHHRVSYRRVVRLTFVSDFMGYFTPGSLGVEATRLYGMARITSDPALSATSMLVERLLALLALVALVLTGLAFDLPEVPREVGTAAWAALALLAAGGLGVMAARVRALTLSALSGLRLRRPAEVLRKVYQGLDHYRSRPLLLIGTFGIGLGFQLLRCTAVAVCAMAFGVQLPFLVFVVVVPVVNLITLLPISIAGVGVRELGFVYLLGQFGVSAEIAVAVSLVMRALTLLSATPGGWLYAHRGIAPAEPRQPAAGFAAPPTPANGARS